MIELRRDVRVAIPGAAMIAVTFGLARYGYGLLLPAMQRDLGVDARTAGLIASAAYVAYLLGNTAVVWLAARFGPRLPIGLAAGSAAAGMIMIAEAHGAAGLAVGVLTAGTAAGLSFPPYADVVASSVSPGRRDLVWSNISSGTGWGVALAGPVAILLGDRWRWAWLVFAAIAVGVGISAVLAAPGAAGRSTQRPPQLSWSWFVCPRSRPLLISSVLVGAGSSVWWAFSVDALEAAGVGQTPARTVYAVCGAAGVLASATGAVTGRLGPRRCYLAACGLLVFALALLGFATASLGAALVAAVLFGVSYNAIIAVQGLWNSEVFVSRPSAGLAAVNTALTVGTIVGPTVAGIVITHAGYPAALATAAAITALGGLQTPPRRAPSTAPTVAVECSATAP